MSIVVTMLDFEGVISTGTMEMLLNQLRESKEFQEMKKPARKRLYGTVVESIDNIFKYSARVSPEIRDLSGVPSVSVKKAGRQYTVATGNLVHNDEIEDLRFKLDRVNQLDNEALKSLYEDIINQESTEEDKGAGLGLITMALRTEHEIDYSFTPVDSEHSFFKMQIKIND